MSMAPLPAFALDSRAKLQRLACAMMKKCEKTHPSSGLRCSMLLAAFSSALVVGCTYRSINPQASLADVRSNNGYYELHDAGPGTAKVVVRTAGTAFPAHFSISTAAQACQQFSDLGDVSFAGRGLVYPWIANAIQRGHRTEPFIVYEAKPGEPIQVRGYRSGHCGPLVSKFTPRDGRAYTVDFVWGGKPECQLVVMDATDPDTPVPVQAQPIVGCPVAAR
jgi:hypothetical protein